MAGSAHYKIAGLILVTSLLLMSCAVGPDFNRPCPPKTRSYTEKPQPKKTVSAKIPFGDPQTFAYGLDIPGEWWALFHSKSLNHLIKRGLKNSPNLEIAEAALRQAEENLNAGIGSLFPLVTAQVSAQRQRSSQSSLGMTTQASVFNLYNASVNVSYILDVFGGIRRQIEALSALVDYQCFTLEASNLTLTSNIVTTSITEASLREQIRATKELIQLNEEQLEIVKSQFQLGGVAQSSVLTQESQLATVKASLPPLENSLSQTRNALSVLIGELPSEAKLPVLQLSDLTLPTTLPVSLPSNLVYQRPDVRAAEALLHEASANIGVATANMLPQITLTGGYGYQSNKFHSLFSPATNIWSYGAQLMQTLFSGGTLTAERRAAIAAYDKACAQYRQTVLQAFQNVADSLIALEIDARLLKVQVEAEEAAKEALNLIREQFKLGGVNYLSLLTAEQQYQQAYINRIQAQASRFNDTVALFQALGGGWWNR